jgi:hypothetical protein
MIRRGTWLGGLFEEAVEELVDRAKQLAVRLRSLRPNNRARAVGGALKLVEMLRSALDVARSHRDEIGKLGVEADFELRLGGTLELLELLKNQYHQCREDWEDYNISYSREVLRVKFITFVYRARTVNYSVHIVTS